MPNAKTKKAIEELEAGGGETYHGSRKEVFDEMLGAGMKRRVWSPSDFAGAFRKDLKRITRRGYQRRNL